MIAKMTVGSLSLITAALLIGLLWKIWTPLCNEGCNGALLSLMYATIFVVVTLPFIALAIMFTPVDNKRKYWLGFSAIVIAVVLGAIALTTVATA